MWVRVLTFTSILVGAPSGQASVASVAQSVSGTATVIVPSCSLAARFLTCGVGASSPASRVSRSSRLRLVRMPRRRRGRARPCGGPRPRTARPPDRSGSQPGAPRPGAPRPGRDDGEQAAPQPRHAGCGAAQTPPTGTHPPPDRPSSAVPAATRSPRAPRRRRASLLLRQRPQDVDLQLQLTNLSGAGRNFSRSPQQRGTPPVSRGSGPPAARSPARADQATRYATSAALLLAARNCSTASTPTSRTLGIRTSPV